VIGVFVLVEFGDQFLAETEILGWAQLREWEKKMDTRTLNLWIFLFFVFGILYIAQRYWREYVQARRQSLQRQAPIDFCFGWFQVLSWEIGQVYVLMRNEKFVELLGADENGGVRFIYPFMGDRVKGPVSRRRQLSKFERDDMKTREGLPVTLHLALEWKITDPQKLLFELDSGITYVTGKSASHGPDAVTHVTEDSSGKNTAETRLLTQVNSVVRKVISEASWDMLISESAFSSLNPYGGASGSNRLHAQNIDKTIEGEVIRQLKQADLGLEITSVVVENVCLTGGLQQKLEEVIIAVKDGEITQTELESRIKKLGLPTVGVIEIMKATKPGFPFPPAPNITTQVVTGVPGPVISAPVSRMPLSGIPPIVRTPKASPPPPPPPPSKKKP
jgi:regulator of protease activity HflC (stomatin/prohibitin superfamily)